MSRPGALDIAAAIASRRISAEAVIGETFRRIVRDDNAVNAFTAVLAYQALADARQLDADIAAHRPIGPLAGVPFAVKNLYDIGGLTTLAGSIIRKDAPPASADAPLVARLKAAGAILVGALNMDEFAYGFVTENHHYGPTRNPHDLSRVSGGSSGGSAAAVAAGIVPLSLGSDTNGSIRVPAGLCGVFGLKPTFGRLDRTGVFPFVDSLDHAGPFARSVEDIAITYDVLKGDGAPIAPTLEALSEQPLRVGVLGGWFVQGAFPEVLGSLSRVAQALDATPGVIAPGAEAARSAAFCLSAYEGARLHAADIRARAQDYDPAVRDRLLAGALLTDDVAEMAQRYRRIFQAEMRALFADYDILLAPSVPCVAPVIGQPTMMLNGQAVSVRQTLGLYTQPISFIGLPVLAAPVNRPGLLPAGVQIIAPAWREDLALAAGLRLQRQGIVAANPPEILA